MSSAGISNLVDLTIELLNDAKSTNDTKLKVYYLEQIKEIVLYRDVSILVGLIPDIKEFMIERGIRVRRWLVKFFSDAMKANPSICSQLLSLYNFYVIDESSDDMIRCIATELKPIYSQIVTSIVKMPTKQKQESMDIKIMWNELKSIVDIIIASITLSQSDATKIECIKFAESIVQFGTPLVETAKVVDPRLKAKKVESVGTSEETSAEIPLHHPFISRTDIEKEADLLFSKMISWVRQESSSEAINFNATTISQISQSIIQISLARTRYLSISASAILSIIEKIEFCKEMSIQSRENLVRSVHRMRHSLSFQPDTKSLVPQFRSSVEVLERLGTDDINMIKSSAVDSINNEQDDKEDSELKTSAMAALSKAENSLKTKRELTGGDSTSFLGIRNAPTFSMTGETEISTFINDYPEAMYTTKASFAKCSIRVANGGILCIDAAPATSDQLNLLAVDSLLRILKNLENITDDKLLAENMHIVTRTALSLAFLDLETMKPIGSITIIHSISAHSFAAKLNEGLPMEVSIPKYILLVINYVLNKENTTISSLHQYLDMISILLNSLLERIMNSHLDANISSLLRKLYDDICLYTLCRMIQNVKLRGHISYFLTHITKVTMKSLKLLNLLMLSGAKNIDENQTKTKSIRIESMNALLMIASNSTEKNSKTSKNAFNFLLWSTVSDDFETRSKVIASLISTSLMHDKVALEHAALFSIEAFIILIGITTVKERRMILQKSVSIIDDSSTVNNNGSCSNSEASSSSSGTITRCLVSLDSALQHLENDKEGIQYSSRYLEVSDSKFESRTKVIIHLLSQLCIVDPSLLTTYFNIYASGVYKLQKLNQQQQQQDNNIISTDILIATTPPTTAASTSTSTSNGNNRLEVFTNIFFENLKMIVPVVASRTDLLDIFDYIQNTDVFAFPLVTALVARLHDDIKIPASSSMVKKVKTYLRDVYGKDSSNNNNSSSSSSCSSVNNKIYYDDIDYSNIDVARLISPIISGYTEAEIIEILPYILKAFKNHPEELKVFFNRIIGARPPPITRANLLISLHRIKHENYEELDQKILIDSIAICIENSDEWKDVIKDVLNILLTDSIIPFMLVRTAILSYQRDSDLKNYMVHTFLPTIIHQKLYENQASIWEGCVYCLNKLATHKDIDISLKALIQETTSLSRIEQVLIGAPGIKPIIANFIKSLPLSEFISQIKQLLGDDESTVQVTTAPAVPKKRKLDKRNE